MTLAIAMFGLTLALGGTTYLRQRRLLESCQSKLARLEQELLRSQATASPTASLSPSRLLIEISRSPSRVRLKQFSRWKGQNATAQAVARRLILKGETLERVSQKVLLPLEELRKLELELRSAESEIASTTLPLPLVGPPEVTFLREMVVL